ncbi:hypothetical protein REPUB_Repub08aG0134300 [Reevesia pubescens]
MCKLWRNALIVKPLGRVLGFRVLSTRIKNLWQLKGNYKIVVLGHDYFLFKFEKQSDYKHVLEGGRWIIGGHYLTVRQWSPNFDTAVDKIEKFIVWIIFMRLPLEYYKEVALTRMGSHVKRVICFDHNNEETLRGKFARICVEVDLTKPLISKMKVGRKMINVEYEELNLICFQCGRVGHKKDNCPITNHVDSLSASVQPLDQEVTTMDDPKVDDEGRSQEINAPVSSKMATNQGDKSTVTMGAKMNSKGKKVDKKVLGPSGPSKVLTKHKKPSLNANTKGLDLPRPSSYFVFAAGTSGYVAAFTLGLMSNLGSSLGIVSGLIVTKRYSGPSKKTCTPPSVSDKSLAAEIIIKEVEKKVMGIDVDSAITDQIKNDANRGNSSLILSLPNSTAPSSGPSNKRYEMVMEIDGIATR